MDDNKKDGENPKDEEEEFLKTSRKLEKAKTKAVGKIYSSAVESNLHPVQKMPGVARTVKKIPKAKKIKKAGRRTRKRRKRRRKSIKKKRRRKGTKKKRRTKKKKRSVKNKSK